MASIQMGGGGGKKSVDQEIPLVPFIDLLLCCVMFLLVTAVWNQLAAMKTEGPGATNDVTAPAPPGPERLILEVAQTGYVLASTDGVRQEIPALAGALDNEGLRQRLEERRRLAPRQAQLIVAPDDDVHHGDLISAMDVALGAGFADVTFSAL